VPVLNLCVCVGGGALSCVRASLDLITLIYENLRLSLTMSLDVEICVYARLSR
jgi:hypothetical protein